MRVIWKIDIAGILGLWALTGCMATTAQKDNAAIEEVSVQQESDLDVEEVEKSEKGLSVANATLCAEINTREAAGLRANFTSDIGRIYFWNNIEGAAGPEEIKHLWYYQNEKIAEVPLKITSSPFRTWSVKTIFPNQTGNWAVLAVTKEGEVLKKVEFTVDPPDAGKEENNSAEETDEESGAGITDAEPVKQENKQEENKPEEIKNTDKKETADKNPEIEEDSAE